MLDNGNSRTRFDTKLNLTSVLKPNIFVQIRSSYAGIFGQVLPKVTITICGMRDRHVFSRCSGRSITSATAAGKHQVGLIIMMEDLLFN